MRIMLCFEFPHRNTYPRIAHKLLDIKRDNVVLEVGCAEGYFSKVLSKGAGWVVSIDIDGTLLREGKRVSGSLYNISSILASTTHLPFKDRVFDRVCLLEVIEHLPLRAEFRCISEINHTLKKGGIFVLSTPNKGKFLQYLFLDGGYFTKGHKHFSLNEVRALLADRGFRVIKLFTSGGIIYAFLFYTFFWRSRFLLQFQVFRKFMKLLIHEAEAEFYREKVDGCVIFAKSTLSAC